MKNLRGVCVVFLAFSLALGISTLLAGCGKKDAATEETVSATAPGTSLTTAEGENRAKAAEARLEQLKAELAAKMGETGEGEVETEPEALVAGEGEDERLRDLAETAGLAVEQKRALANSYVEAAKKYLAEHDYVSAEACAYRAYSLDPTNKEAIRIWEECGLRLGKRPSDVKAKFGRAIDEHGARQKQVKLEIERYVADGKRAYTRTEYALALEKFNGALHLIKSLPYEVDLRTVERTLEELIAMAEEDMMKQNQLRERERKDVAEMLVQTVADDARAKEQARLKQLYHLGRVAYESREYDKARRLAELILYTEPMNYEAQKLRAAAIRTGYFANVSQRGQDRTREWKETFEHVEELTIPYHNLIRFPSHQKWEAVKNRAGRMMGDRPDIESEEEREILAHLGGALIPQVDFEDRPLEEVVEFLRTISGVNMLIDRRIYDEEGEDYYNIDLNLSSPITAEKMLSLIMRLKRLRYTIEDGVLIIGSKTGIEKPYLKMYNIRDLMITIKSFPGPVMELAMPSGEEQVGINVTGFDDEEEAMTGDDIVELIQEHIDPEGWDEGEGQSIMFQAGNLLVRHSKTVQAEINQLLSYLRSSTGIMVNIETRFLEVSDNFLRDVGIDWRGLGMPVPNPAPPPATNPHFWDNPLRLDDVFAPTTPVSETNSDPRVHAVGSDTSPGIWYNDASDGDLRARIENLFDNVVIGNPAILQNTGGLSLGFTLLDDIHLEALMHAVAKTQRASVLTAPRVTAYNTQRVNISLFIQRAYIRDYDVQLAAYAAIADPIPDFIRDGLVLDVQPTVSSDRRYITVELRPSIARLNPQTPFRTVGVFLGGGSFVVLFLPQISLMRARTTVTIPDGGTILLGGLTNITKQDFESSVPWLHNVPILNFFFKRKGKTRIKTHNVILLRAHVIVLEEEENRL